MDVLGAQVSVDCSQPETGQYLTSKSYGLVNRTTVRTSPKIEPKIAGFLTTENK
jgi:hypothetical protein